ncbi:unnamed protein product [Orchesella dallaii]|uniref:Cullin family profile domain-containing protein n=1 Tax=Orchesella dallaii TaxID=48710 RepID=A0ABP1S2A7_9HEXA
MDSVIRSGLVLYKHEIPYGNLNQYQNEIEKLVPIEQKIEDLPLSNILEFLIKVQKTLLQKNWALYLEEIESLLVIKKTEFIKRVYTLLKRLKMTVELDEMKNCLKNHFRLALQQASFTNQNMARTYVDRVLSSHREQTTIAKSISEADTLFLEMLDKLCLQFLSQSQNSTQKLCEVLAAHCNSILSKSKTKISEEELNASLKQVLYLYDYLEDRDIFEMLYRKMMACRIVSRNSASPEAESMMVEKMRFKFEYGYVSKLDGMLKVWNCFVIVKFEDAKFSKELTANFNTSLGAKASSLPLLQHCVMQFNEFYKAACRNRKQQWLHDHSRGEILSSCFQKRYCFKASTLQMTVLLLFNSKVSYSIGELGELTKLGGNCLLHVLESLIKAKILIALNGEKGGDLNRASVISLVKTYENARLHVDIAPPIELKEDQFWRLSHKSIRKDSSIRIQAVIVRIMRRNRVMRHDNLVAEVLEQKSSLNYTITVQVVEAGINTLIENGDLDRKDGQHDEYVYEG